METTTVCVLDTWEFAQHRGKGRQHLCQCLRTCEEKKPGNRREDGDGARDSIELEHKCHRAAPAER